MAHDQGGEFMTMEWKDLLRQHGIQAVLSAAPWQRGRIERHGGIIEEMLSRIDQELPIQTSQQFDEALTQCFHAKNTMSISLWIQSRASCFRTRLDAPGIDCVR